MQIGTKWTLLYCIRRPPGISKRKQSSDRREEWDNSGPRGHADPLMREDLVCLKRLYCRTLQTFFFVFFVFISYHFFFSLYHFSVSASSIAREFLLFAVPLLSLCPEHGRVIHDGKTFLGIYLSFMGSPPLFSSFAANPWSSSLRSRQDITISLALLNPQRSRRVSSLVRKKLRRFFIARSRLLSRQNPIRTKHYQLKSALSTPHQLQVVKKVLRHKFSRALCIRPAIAQFREVV